MTATTAWYSVVRYVPDLVRNEQINVGLILVDSSQGFAAVRRAGSAALKRLPLAGTDPSFVQASLDLIQAEIQAVAARSDKGRHTEELGAAFRILRQAHQNNILLTAPQPVAIELASFEAVHQKLYRRFVERTLGRHEGADRPTRRQMLGHVKATFRRYGLFRGSETRVVSAFRPDIPAAVPVDLVFRNGRCHFYQVLSLNSDVPAVTAARAYVDMAREISRQSKDASRRAEFHVFGEPTGTEGTRSTVEELLQRRGVTLLHYKADAERVAAWIKKQQGSMPSLLSSLARGH